MKFKMSLSKASKYDRLLQLKIKICILLDDVQHIDYASWQFLSAALDNNNVVVAMTILKPDFGENLIQTKMDIYKDSRLMQRILLGLDVNLLPALMCQLLNVLAIPRRLYRYCYFLSLYNIAFVTSDWNARRTRESYFV